MYVDPIKATYDTSRQYVNNKDLLHCNLICVHANLHKNPPYSSYHLLNESFLSKLAVNTVIINASRGGIVNESHLLMTQNHLIYCTDVFCNEPNINSKLLEFAHLCTPHIAGHSIEAKELAVRMLAEKIIHHLSHDGHGQVSALTSLDQFSFKKGWQEQVLSIYNPLYETMHLKQANNKMHAFISQRNAHKHRHNFSFYNFHPSIPDL